MSLKSDLTSGHPARVTSALCVIADHVERQARRIALLEAEVATMRDGRAEPTPVARGDGERPRSAILDALERPKGGP